MARRLYAAGVRKGDRVGLLLQASLDAFALQLGAMRLGAIPVPINARFKARELRYVIGHSGMKILITDPAYAALLEEAGAAETCRVVVGTDDAEVRRGCGRRRARDCRRRAGRGRRGRRRADALHVGHDRPPEGLRPRSRRDHGGGRADRRAARPDAGRPLLDAAAVLPRRQHRDPGGRARRLLRLAPDGPLRADGRARPARGGALHRRVPRLRDDLARRAQPPSLSRPPT